MFRLILTALFPALVIGSVFYFMDRHREPFSKVAKTFLMGILSAITVIILSAIGLIDQYGSEYLNASMNTALFKAAIPEEITKMVFFMATVYFSKEFDEWYDGILYGIIIGLGFAFLENIVYFVSFFDKSGYYIVIMRSVLSMPLHALVGGIMGYFLGKTKFRTDLHFRILLFLPALILPIIFHTIFNYMLMQYNSLFSAGVIVGAQWIIVLSMVKYSRQVFRPDTLSLAPEKHSNGQGD